MPATKNSVKATLKRTKVTKGAVMYEAPENVAVMTNLYLRKDALETIGATVDTEEIEITLTAK